MPAAAFQPLCTRKELAPAPIMLPADTERDGHAVTSPQSMLIIHISALGQASCFPPHRCVLRAPWDTPSALPAGWTADVLQILRGPSGDKGSIRCSWTPVLWYKLGLQEPPMLPTRPLAIASRSRHRRYGTTKDWEPTTQPWSRALQPGECREAGRLAPAPQSLLPLEDWLQHLGVTSTKDQAPNRTTTRQDKMDIPKCAHTYTRTCTGAGEQARRTLTGTALAVTGV